MPVVSAAAERTAVVLFNLGGPDRPEAVRPFLFNLFKDGAIIGAPTLVRWPLAAFIAWRRAPIARQAYAQIGGSSPLLKNSRAQAGALERRLRAHGHDVAVFVCMRYWHPMSPEVVTAVKAWAPRKLVLLPLYPQFSTATSASAFNDWRHTATAAGLEVDTKVVCCYPTAQGLVRAHAELVAAALKSAPSGKRARVLFSAHGLPERTVADGDPYRWQVERTVEAVVTALEIDDLDYAVCFQSRVGPLRWIGPSIADELARAGRDGVPVMVVPIAFVSEHVETLVELDIEYARRARELGVPTYVRVPALGTAAAFIDAMAVLVDAALGYDGDPRSEGGGRRCPPSWSRCPCPPPDQSGTAGV